MFVCLFVSVVARFMEDSRIHATNVKHDFGGSDSNMFPTLPETICDLHATLRCVGVWDAWWPKQYDLAWAPLFLIV